MAKHTHRAETQTGVIRATAILSKHKGNQHAYFSLTGDEFYRDTRGLLREGSCGCIHELILDALPFLSDIAALHLSDIDGVPMHGAANGWYWLAGALLGADQGAGNWLHAGNGSSAKSREECLQLFADHCRISLSEAVKIRTRVQAKFNYPDMKREALAIIETMRPRWKLEARACIARHNLQIVNS